MGLSRRKFTREFKVAALRRLDTGASIAEVARACEIDPNLLHRWRKEFKQAPEQAFPGLGSAGTTTFGLRNWSGRSDANPWRSIFPTHKAPFRRLT